MSHLIQRSAGVLSNVGLAPVAGNFFIRPELRSHWGLRPTEVCGGE